MIYFLLVVSAVGILLEVLLIIFWLTNFKNYTLTKNKPFVSILIAARNEENNIINCLESLVGQKYPNQKFEIIVGNDSSEDTTLDILKKYSEEHNNIHILDIKEQVGMARGKSNVLAQLVHIAKGEVFLITDADIRLNSNWIQGMVKHLDKDTGIINGFTVVEENLMQHYEWAKALGMVKVITDLKQPVTAIGNNMLITRDAYISTGGYENLPFSLTEDFQIFKEASKNGYRLKQVVCEDVLAFSKSPGDLISLLNQRKRWMTGAVQLPWFVVIILLLEGIYYPALVGLFFLAPVQALYIFLVKLLFQSLFIKVVLKKVHLPLKGGLLLFEIYAAFSAIISMVYYLIPGKIDWKGRKYKS